MVCTQSAEFDDGPVTLKRFIYVGEPTILVTELRGAEAAAMALSELAAADAKRPPEDEPITQEFIVPRYTPADFDPSLIDALQALESEQPGADDDAITQEFVVPHYTAADFDPALIDALEALENDAPRLIDNMIAVNRSRRESGAVSFRTARRPDAGRTLARL